MQENVHLTRGETEQVQVDSLFPSTQVRWHGLEWFMVCVQSVSTQMALAVEFVGLL
jgi:hypothetical protein